jgi:hypothetical protein
MSAPLDFVDRRTLSVGSDGRATTLGSDTTGRCLSTPLEAGMRLRLVSSGDGPALAIRDHVVPLIRSFGIILVQRDTVRVVAWHTGAWEFEHWTPFNDLQPGEASSPGYRRALERQHTEPDLPYGLDVRFAGTKVLSILWADDGSFDIAAFTRGPWEQEALALNAA